MSRSDAFEDLIIWREAIDLAKDVFLLFENCSSFSLRNQIERAVISISSNIAEGYELSTNRQFVKYLYTAKGSCGEVRSQLTLARELGLFQGGDVKNLIDKSRRLSIMIYNLIKERSKGI